MTLPDERYRAVLMAERLLQDITDPQVTPRVPKEIRQRARGVLRHYPGEWDMQVAAKGAPDYFAERIEDVSRMILKYTESKREA